MFYLSRSKIRYFVIIDTFVKYKAKWNLKVYEFFGSFGISSRVQHWLPGIGIFVGRTRSDLNCYSMNLVISCNSKMGILVFCRYYGTTKVPTSQKNIISSKHMDGMVGNYLSYRYFDKPKIGISSIPDSTEQGNKTYQTLLLKVMMNLYGIG